MSKEQFLNELGKLRVYDAHTHLVGAELRAKSFWEIVHYFWFLRELFGAGYPENFAELDEDKRADEFLRAFNKTKSTGMNFAVRSIFKDLYGLEFTDKKSIYTGIEMVKASSSKDGWQKEVAAKGNIIHMAINDEEPVEFEGLEKGACIWYPRIDWPLIAAVKRIAETEPAKRQAAAEKERDEFIKLLTGYYNKGARAFMSTIDNLRKKTWNNSGEALSDWDDCFTYMLHAICKFAEERKMGLQFFLGIERREYFRGAAPVDYSSRVINLYGLFEMYNINFDLVTGAEGSNMDLVQAGHNFTKVYVGGMWWFNFRPSTFLDAMAKRFEALASNKSYLSISDSRCIEWCYGKNALIRKLTGDFLVRKIDEGFVNQNEALAIAEDWLYNSARNLYGGNL